MATLNSSGTSGQTSGGVETTLQTLNSAGTFQFCADLTLMANASTPDVVLLRIYSQIANAGSYLLEDVHSYSGAQAAKFWRSKPYGVVYGLRLTVEQPTGTTRALPWISIQY